MLFIYFPWETKVIFDKIFKQSPKKYYLQMLKYAVVTILTGIITYLACSLINGSSIIILMLKAMICGILPNIAFICMYRKTEEYQNMKRRVINIINRKRGVA